MGMCIEMFRLQNIPTDTNHSLYGGCVLKSTVVMKEGAEFTTPCMGLCIEITEKTLCHLTNHSLYGSVY